MQLLLPMPDLSGHRRKWLMQKKRELKFQRVVNTLIGKQPHDPQQARM